MQQEHPILEIHGQPSPIIATAIHDGHYLSPGLEVLSGLTDEERLREEDPFTTDMISKFPTRVIAKRSRFEFDLNRAPESCIYLKPEDAWGLPVWKEMPNDEQLMECISGYDLAYSELKSLVKLSIEEFGQVVVLECTVTTITAREQISPSTIRFTIRMSTLAPATSICRSGAS